MLAHDGLEWSHTFWLRGTVGSETGSWLPSLSDGWDSCFAAACNTRFWTSNEEGDVGNPKPFDSNFPAAHENALAPSLTGESNNLWRRKQNNEIKFNNRWKSKNAKGYRNYSFC